MVQLLKHSQHGKLPFTGNDNTVSTTTSYRCTHQRMCVFLLISFLLGSFVTMRFMNITSSTGISGSQIVKSAIYFSGETSTLKQPPGPPQNTIYDRHGNIRSQDDDQGSTGQSSSYTPSFAERYVYEHGIELGLNHRDFFPSGCYLWGNYKSTTRNSVHLQPNKEEEEILKIVPHDIQEQVLRYKESLKQYNTYISEQFILQLPYIVENNYNNHEDGVRNLKEKEIRYTDIRHALRYHNHSEVCDSLHVPLHTIFGGGSSSSSNTLLSKLDNTNTATGLSQYMEPLLPPLRSLDLCLDKNQYLLDLAFHVHDFQQICYSFTPYSRTIFIDMGASLLFHDNDNPAIYMAQLYKKFGIVFDHVYAYEYTTFTPEQTQSLFKELIPDLWKTSYHWINVGVDEKLNATMNPFTMIKQHFLPEDFIVVKLDVDTASVEMPLLNALLNDAHLHTLVDQFYFEYHIVIKEISMWGLEAAGTIFDAMKAITQLREKGVPARFWV